MTANNIQLDDDSVSGYNTEIAVKPSQYMEGLHDFWLKDLHRLQSEAAF